MQNDYDVIIAGAGPVGLFLACELRLADCSVLVLERDQDRPAPLKLPPLGMRGLSAATMDILDRRDLLGPLTARTADDAPVRPAHWTAERRRRAGHFAGIPFFHDQIEHANWPWRLPGPTASLPVDLAGLEAVLSARAEALGADIRRGHAVEGVKMSADGIAVRRGDDMLTGQWLVGCDGGRSMVRKAAGFVLEGSEPELTGYSAVVELADAALLRPGAHATDRGMYIFTPPGTVGMVDFDGGASHRRVPLTREHVEAVLRGISGTDVRVTRLHLATTWTDRAMQARAYRRGRVLLAGDAAHVHAPFGGQGLNLGLGDAINLGWKLGRTIKGIAPAGLLDSYAAERQPAGARILDWSRSQVAAMRPDSRSRALMEILRDLLATRDGAAYCLERVAGIDFRYDCGGGHPLVGRSVPDFALSDGTSLYRHMRDGLGVLLDTAGLPPLAALARGLVDVRYIACSLQEPSDILALLVRPDGIVAWVATSADQIDGVGVATSRWFGTPAMAGAAP